MRLVAVPVVLLLLLAADGGAPPPPPQPGGGLPPGAVELLPPGAAQDVRLPLVIAIHGRGGNALRFGQFVQNSAAGAAARIVALQGPGRFLDGYSWFDRRLSRDGGDEDDDRALTEDILKRVEEIRPAIAAVAKSRPHCGAPIIVGFSQGGALTLGLAVTAPADFKAEYFEIAGALPPAFPFGANLPNLTGFHGTADALVPFSAAEATFRRAPKTVTWSLFAYEGAGHDPPRELRQDLGAELKQAFQRACAPAPAPAPAKAPGP